MESSALARRAASSPLLAVGAFLAFGACLGIARAELVLNEVLYDPAGPDEGAEFIELWNPDPLPHSLDGIIVEAADGAKPDLWSRVFAGSVADTISPRSAFLIVGSRLPAALQNGPDAIRLARGGVVLDRLGYGDPLDQSLVEGLAAPDVPSGHSLARRDDGVDSDRNREDWEDEAIPTPGQANRPDERIVLRPGRLTLNPAVPWPGETLLAETVVRNRGKLPIERGRWELVLEWSPDLAGASEPDHAAFQPSAVAPGPGLAPGESAAIHVPFVAPPEGAFLARARIAPSAGVPESRGLADTLSVAGRTRASPAVVSEIAFRDAGAGEWIELWFRMPIEDAGLLSIGDAGSAPRSIDRGSTPHPVPAGAFLVVAQDPSALSTRYGIDSSAVLGVLGGWPPFNDGPGPDGFADLVRILGGGGVPSDVVPYDARLVSRGGSLERLSPDLPGHQATSWGESIDAAGATPGRPNSLRAPETAGSRTRGALLLASDRVLRRGLRAAPILLRLTPEARGRALVVRVLDLVGRPVRTLVRGQRFASDGVFAWDGLDAAGAAVPPGLYVIAAEAAPENNRGPRRSTLVVAVSAGGARK